MELKDKLNILKDEILKEQNIISINLKDMIRLLSLLYTYNHGNKICQPLEYALKDGNKTNGGGDYLKLEKDIYDLGYKIVDIIFTPNTYQIKGNQDAYEKRKQTKEILPSDIKQLIIGTKNGELFPLFETSESLELLALSGDDRAIGTYDNWLKIITNNKDNNKKKIKS